MAGSPPGEPAPSLAVQTVGENVTTREARSEGTAATGQQPRHLGLALAVIATAQLMVVLDATIVNVALPHIQHALGFSGSNLEWVVNAYALAFGGLLLLGGRTGDLLGRAGSSSPASCCSRSPRWSEASPPANSGCSRRGWRRGSAEPSPPPPHSRWSP